MLTNIRIVLVSPSHPGNVGGAARAMKTMGLENLFVVAPRRELDEDAVARASGAEDVLGGARICTTLNEALEGCRLVVGTSARDRRLRWPMLTPHRCGERLVAEASLGQVALVFGRERSGLTNEELERCNFLVTIPANPDYASLNLASAVQVLAYEIRVAFLESSGESPVPVSDTPDETLVGADDMERLYAHFAAALTDIGFFESGNPEMVMRRLRRLFNRTRLDRNELNILRGVLRAAQERARGQRSR